MRRWMGATVGESAERRGRIVSEDSWLVVNWRSETFVVVNPRSMRNNEQGDLRDRTVDFPAAATRNLRLEEGLFTRWFGCVWLV